MNSDPIAELNVNSSQLEREWLAQIQHAVPDVFLIEPALTETPPLAVVSVPDFLFDQFSQDENEPGQATKSTQRCSSDRNQGDSRATPNRGEPKHDGLGPRQLDGRSATPIARMHAANDCHGTEAVARQGAVGVQALFEKQASGRPVDRVPTVCPQAGDGVDLGRGSRWSREHQRYQDQG